MKIIFLDMMGVFFSGTGRQQQPNGCTFLLDGEQQPGVDPAVVEALNLILDTVEDSFVCIASTLRLEYGIGSIKFFMENLGVRTGRVLFQTPELAGEAEKVRGEEITKWLQTTGERKGVTSYVVIDDNWVRPHLDQQVRTSGHFGLTVEDAKEAIEILG